MDDWLVLVADTRHPGVSGKLAALKHAHNGVAIADLSSRRID